jgi:hypothetical protein
MRPVFTATAPYDPRRRYLNGLGALRTLKRRRRLLHGLGIHTPGRRFLGDDGSDNPSLGPYSPIDLSAQPYDPGVAESGFNPTELASEQGALDTAIAYSPPGSTVAITPTMSTVAFPVTGAQAAVLASAAPTSASWLAQTNALGLSNQSTLFGLGAIALLALLTGSKGRR